jgi:GTP pyrophosphokinase
VSHDRSFLLTDIVTVTSQYKANMLKVSATVNQENLTTTIKMMIQVHNVTQLKNLIANLRKVDGVITVERDNH